MKIVWSRRAVTHLQHIRDHIATDMPDAAAETVAVILETIKLLTRHPAAGRAGRISGTRELIISGTPYVVPYRVVRGRLEILGVFHGRQKWPDRLPAE